MNTTFISLFAGPGAGKSTAAAGIFSHLKQLGYDAELVPEFAKELVWENHSTALENQSYVTARQFYMINRLKGKCEFVITDSPVFLGAAYATSEYPQCYLDTLAWWNSLTATPQYNFFITREHSAFEQNGRVHSELESKMIDDRILSLMDAFNVHHETLSADTVIEHIVKKVCTEFPK